MDNIVNIYYVFYLQLIKQRDAIQYTCFQALFYLVIPKACCGKNRFGTLIEHSRPVAIKTR